MGFDVTGGGVYETIGAGAGVVPGMLSIDPISVPIGSLDALAASIIASVTELPPTGSLGPVTIGAATGVDAAISAINVPIGSVKRSQRPACPA